jgi:hypothetical protein
MMCWKLHPPELAWETNLSDRWTDPETGEPFAQEETLNWSLDYMIHPSDQSILIAADGREAILFCLATGEEAAAIRPAADQLGSPFRIRRRPSSSRFPLEPIHEALRHVHRRTRQDLSFHRTWNPASSL